MTQIAFGLSPAHALRLVADAEDADLVVVGSHHRSRLQRFVSTDIAMQVFHDAPCAVAIAPDEHSRCRGLERIGVGIDPGAESAAALDLALKLAGQTGAQLRLVAVASNVYTGAPALAMGTASLDAYRDILDGRAHAARAALNAALERCDPARATGEVRMGDPTGELIGLSADCDLLVLGPRRWGTALRLALGSTSQAVIREARCPVLVPPRTSATAHDAVHRAAHENVLI